MVGLPGSGKSTFAKCIADNFPNVIRLSQDENGRKFCENAFGKKEYSKQTLVLDRCNLDKQEREYWRQLAHKCRTWVVYCDISTEEVIACNYLIFSKIYH